MGDNAFMDVSSSVSSIAIPSAISSVGSYAFYHCSNPTSVVYLGSNDPGKWQSGIFGECDQLRFVCVPTDYNSSSFCGFNQSQFCKHE